MGFVMPNYRAPKRSSALPVTITDPGNVFPTINTSDCLAWPSDAWKKAGGIGAWAGWTVGKGEQGFAVARTKHCFQNTTVVFVEIGSHFVPIGESGIVFEAGAIDELPKLEKPSSP